MIRGTTPILEIELPFNADVIKKAYVTLSQCGAVIVDKPITECSCEANKVVAKLTQKETLKLNCAYPVEIQMRVVTLNDDALASEIVSERVDRILREGEI